MADYYRKSSLDKLSSPEQLDRAITIISPSFWVAAIGGGLIIAVVLIWSVFGRLPVSVSTIGMYMGDNGIYNAVAEADGLVDEVFIVEGQDVTAGQKLVQLDDDLYTKKIADLEARRDTVESVTFYSYDDPSNTDTKPLLDIKAEAKLTGTALSADQIALRDREKSLSKQRSKTRAAASDFKSKKKKYYNKQAAYLKAQTAYKKAQDALTSARNAYEAYEKTVSDPPTAEQEEQLKKLEEAVSDANDDFRKAESSLQKLELQLKNAETDYNRAMQSYENEKSALKSMNETVSQLRTKVRGDRVGKNDQENSLEDRFDSAKGSAIDQINQDIDNLQTEANNLLFTAKIGGRVTSVNVSRGDAVKSGMTLFKIVSEDNEQDDVVLYVPVANGRKIQEGMKADVYPSTINRQEYGHMTGIVAFVSDYTATTEDLLNELGDQALVQGFQQNGSVVRVTITLDRDPATESGYKWSSKKGGQQKIKEGTVVSADVITETKAPITMLIPYLKTLFSTKSYQENMLQNNDVLQAGEY